MFKIDFKIKYWRIEKNVSIVKILFFRYLDYWNMSYLMILENINSNFKFIIKFLKS